MAAHGRDHPRHFQPQGIGRARWRWIVACALKQVGAVERGGMNINQHLIRAVGGVGGLLPDEWAVALVTLDMDSVHTIGFLSRWQP